jgi:hypothetical protein
MLTLSETSRPHEGVRMEAGDQDGRPVVDPFVFLTWFKGLADSRPSAEVKKTLNADRWAPRRPGRLFRGHQSDQKRPFGVLLLDEPHRLGGLG